MNCSRLLRATGTATAICFLALLGVAAVGSQQTDSSAIVRAVDAAAKARIDGIASYTVTEHYAVFRGKDETNPAAEMTVRTTYQKDLGKSYTVVSESGSSFIRNHVLVAILDREKEINLPGVREHAWLNSANYEMTLKPGGSQRLNGRDCVVLAIVPRHKAPNMIEGTLWVDASDGSIVQIQGTASQSPSIFTGPANVLRQYAEVNGFSMATQARAVSDSFLLGRTIVTIDYRDYQIQLAAAK